jgi:2-dehydro-3-deoxyphosphogluconate aldolase/(4S)-4-hydroxy-2-oxoglutarate aldolase
MGRFRRLEVLQTMVESGLVPVFYHEDIDVTRKVARAVAEGGARHLEFTNRGDFAWQVFAELNRWCAKEVPQLILGAGSVIDPETAAMYINNGADFVVGPVLNADVARVCHRRKIAYIPGCGSAGEISQAEALGVEICKIFPASEVGGPSFVKSILGPMPWSLLMPTGGVDRTRDNIEKWFKAGAACVGIGSNLITREILDAGAFDTLSRHTAELLQWIRDARGPAKT